jgi:lipoyl(octanoyl) transferase
MTARLEGFTGSAERERLARPPANLAVRDLGCMPYPEAMSLQDELVEARLNGTIPDTLLLLEHPPVITLGRRGSLSDVFVSERDLVREAIAVEHTTRGGLVTYHGPGQLVGYPIVHLRERKLSIPCYVRALELAIIAALAELGIEAHLDDEHIGVWTSSGKIAAIGVAQRHGVTLHGFAVNLQPNLDHFALINPCGIGHLGVTSAEVLLGYRVDINAFKSTIATALDAALTQVSCQSADPPH